MIQRYEVNSWYDEDADEPELNKNARGNICKWVDVERLAKIAFKNGIFALDMERVWKNKFLDELYEKQKKYIESDFKNGY